MHRWRTFLQKNNPAKDGCASVPIAQSGGGSGKAPEPKIEDKEKKDEASNAQVDVERGTNKGTGESSKFRSPWHIWH